MPHRKTPNLSRHRVSVAGARYFVTCCTRGRRALLLNGETPFGLIENIDLVEREGDARPICATLMPDHIHWIFVLGSRLTLSQVIARWKVATRSGLAGEGLEWQENFYEHRLRDDESVEGYAFYMFMNPYVARLIPTEMSWPWWRIGSGVRFGFERKLRANGSPQEQWLNDPAARGEGLGVNERD